MPKRYLKISCLILFILSCLFVSAFSFFHQRASGSHIISLNNSKELLDFSHYTPDRIPFISSHRGAPKKGLPENCIATFENTLQHAWSLLEIDPLYKDSSIVLMHDPTLNRTSSGTGKVSDYTLAAIRKLKLKDTEGNITTHTIPTLDEVLEGAKGKTILIVDHKDVSVDVRVRKIKEHYAEANAMVMAYSLADAKRCYELDKNIMIEAAFIGDLKKRRSI